MSIFKSVLLLISIFTSFSSHAVEAINTFNKSGGFFSGPSRSKDKLAILGYDPVAYFNFTDEKGALRKGSPTPGNDNFTFKYQDALWKFSNQTNLDKFKTNPQKYAPQYGGYCAFGVAKDDLVKIEPEQYTIINDKLYLNFDRKVNEIWLKDKEKFIKEADAKFSNLVNKK